MTSKQKKPMFSDVLEPAFKKEISNVLSRVGKSLERLYDIATKDEKTGIYNHRFFKTIFHMELERAKRGGELSLIIIDIDFFKKFNDKYGHLVGDVILKELASVLQKILRKYDVLARFGGEEFFVLLPDTSVKKAEKVAERLRKNIWVKSRKLKKFGVTISLGVTGYKKNDTMARMIKRADKALYISKKGGRNKTSII